MGSTYHEEDLQCEQCGRSYLLITRERDEPDFHKYQVVIRCPQGHEQTLTLAEDFSVLHPTTELHGGGGSRHSEWEPVR